MYIIAIAWLYVTVLMAATEKTITSGLLTFVCYGLLPCALLLWILGVKHRRHIKNKQVLLEEEVSKQDRADPNRDK
jgi:hypothetical protein